VLQSELLADATVAEHLTFTVQRVGDTDFATTLSHGPLVDLVIQLADGVLASAAYESIKGAVSRAKNRGDVDDLSNPEQGPEDAGTTGS